MQLTEEQRLDQGLVRLLNDPDFERIELELDGINVFDVLGAIRAEVRHSNFLAWLLDPQAKHGLGGVFLSRVIRDLLADNRSTSSVLEADTMDYGQVEVRREWQRIDILILTPSFVFCIENKVDSSNHSNQLARYKATVEKNFPDRTPVFVYLTPYGEAPTKLQDVYIPYALSDIGIHLEQLLEVYSEGLNTRQRVYIQDYLNILKRHIMKNDELTHLVAKLYKRHEQALEYIFENKPDARAEVASLLIDRVKKAGWNLGSTNNSYVRFLTPALNDWIPRYEGRSRGWKHKESFLFEFVIKLNSGGGPDKLVFKPVISPKNENAAAVHETLIDVMGSIPGAKSPRGEQWIVHFREVKKIPSKMANMDDEERLNHIEAFWPSVEAIVSKVELALLDARERFA